MLQVFGGSPSGGNGHHCGSRKIGTEGKGQRAGTHIPGLHGMEYNVSTCTLEWSMRVRNVRTLEWSMRVRNVRTLEWSMRVCTDNNSEL